MPDFTNYPLPWKAELDTNDTGKWWRVSAANGMKITGDLPREIAGLIAAAPDLYEAAYPFALADSRIDFSKWDGESPIYITTPWKRKQPGSHHLSLQRIFDIRLSIAKARGEVG